MRWTIPIETRCTTQSSRRTRHTEPLTYSSASPMRSLPFAGSMPFVYIHAIVFAVWMLTVESDPWPKLTLVVSL